MSAATLASVYSWTFRPAVLLLVALSMLSLGTTWTVTPLTDNEVDERGKPRIFGSRVVWEVYEFASCFFGYGGGFICGPVVYYYDSHGVGLFF